MGKPFLKIQIKQTKKNQYQNAEFEKKQARNGNLVQTKNKAQNDLRKDCENHLEENPSKKNRKISKNQSEIAACEQKTTGEKTNFCSNTVFSLYFKLERKNFTPQNYSLFRSTSCFVVTKITTPS